MVTPIAPRYYEQATRTGTVRHRRQPLTGRLVLQVEMSSRLMQRSLDGGSSEHVSTKTWWRDASIQDLQELGQCFFYRDKTMADCLPKFYNSMRLGDAPEPPYYGWGLKPPMDGGECATGERVVLSGGPMDGTETRVSSGEVARLRFPVQDSAPAVYRNTAKVDTQGRLVFAFELPPPAKP